MKEQVRQQGEYESIHRDLNIGFGTWEFDPTEIKNPFPENEGSVHIARPGKRVGSGRVGSWVKMGSGRNGFGSKRVN
ncbi:hypothetical protein HanHA300_Chr01g0035051 [Helianthus annuus]|nr:hypothetical protein HanHA300_Chr01g0035051 [Helianthus annuus]KAJ0784825.1 hypothetical protein HanLR1_Chr01g0036111 [Helianthus annuus]KAJ0794099.1 hypothetical protein HanOQP8_Chr01g0036361 [Helianthus annuus]